MFDWISLLIAIFVFAIIGLLVYKLIKATIINKQKDAVIAQLMFDNSVYVSEISLLLDKKQELELAQSDGFVGFVSKSRDWAFEYIENVQDSISSLKLAVENGYPTEEEMEKLFNFLPDNKENNNE